MADFTRITTLVTPASSLDLTTLADVKEELGLTATTDDVWLAKIITRASARIARACNLVFVKETVRDEFWPHRDPAPGLVPGGLDPLQLSRWPLTAVAPIVVEDGVTLTNAVDYRVDAARGRLVRLDASLYPCAWRALPIAVTFEAGSAAIPADLADAAIILVKLRWFARKRDPSLKSETIDGVRTASWWISTTSDSAMPPDVADIIDRFRVPVVA